MIYAGWDTENNCPVCVGRNSDLEEEKLKRMLKQAEGYTAGEAIEAVLKKFSNSPLLVAALSSLFFVMKETGQEKEKLKLWEDIDLMFHGYWRNDLDNLTKLLENNLVKIRESLGVEYYNGEWRSKQREED